MADVLMIATVLGFFAVCVAYVSWCDRIIGPDDGLEAPVPAEAASRDAELVAS